MNNIIQKYLVNSLRMPKEFVTLLQINFGTKNEDMKYDFSKSHFYHDKKFFVYKIVSCRCDLLKVIKRKEFFNAFYGKVYGQCTPTFLFYFKGYTVYDTFSCLFRRRRHFLSCF